MEVQNSGVDNDIVFSEEVQEIMGHVPNWIVRSGLIIIFLIFSSVIIGSYFYKFPESVKAPLVLTTVNSPAPLVARVNGRINTWFVSNGQSVKKGSYVALIENSADLNHVVQVKDFLAELTSDWHTNVMHYKLSRDRQLGTIYEPYLQFFLLYKDFGEYLFNNDVEERIARMEKIINVNEEHLALIKKQYGIKIDRYLVSKKIFLIDSTFGQQNKFGTAKREFDLSSQAFLQEKENLVAFEAGMKSAELSLLSLREQLSEIETTKFVKLKDYDFKLNEARQRLESAIESWTETYLVVSPIVGTITFTTFWSSNQILTQGEQLATVVPSGKTSIIARAIIPTSALGKVVAGQQVNIKLSSFPYMEFGILSGIIRNISLVPIKDGYIVEIDLTKGMISNYSEKLKFVEQMDGTAEIITGDSRLISRFIRPLKNILNN